MSRPLQIQFSADPSAEETAAAIAAILSLIATDGTPAEQPTPPGRWRDAAKLVAQGLTPTRTPARPGWGTIERLRRAGKGGSGITGM